MKSCLHCNKTYPDEFGFCSVCGKSLVLSEKSVAKTNKNMHYAIILVAIIVIIAIIFGIVEQKKISNTRKEIHDYKRQKKLEEYLNTPTSEDIRIDSGWKVVKDGSYLYIRGTVTNTSLSKTISYFEIEAKFHDSNGNVINSDWTNDAEDLAPGESRKFEIMHKYSSDEKDISIRIKDVR